MRWVSPVGAAAVFWVLVCCSMPCWGQPQGRTLRIEGLGALLADGDGLAVAGPDGRLLLAQNETTPLIPASTLKLLTVLAGFDVLGPEYRFPTDFFLDAEGSLVIKGYGDPMLVSEVVETIAHRLREALGPAPAVKDIVLDESYFGEPLSIPGVSDSYQPYDAPNGALCVNFNTVFFRRSADGALESAEPQTPLLPVVEGRIRASGLASGRIVLSRSRKEALRYAGHLFLAFLEDAGVRVEGRIRPGTVDADRDRLLFRHRSPFTLEAAAARLMEYSNNYMANQILIAAGARRYGPPGTLDKGTRAAQAFAEEKLHLRRLSLKEGSGISRANRMTALGLLTVLSHFAPHRHLLDRQGRLRVKTGTLAGIQTRAGYIEAGDGLYRVVVLVNTPGRAADPMVQALVKALP